MPRGGARPGAGRKPKSEEQALLDVIIRAGKTVTGNEEPMQELWGVVWRQAIDGCQKSQRLVNEYVYGKPKQRIEADVTHDQMPAIIIRKPNDADL